MYFEDQHSTIPFLNEVLISLRFPRYSAAVYDVLQSRIDSKEKDREKERKKKKENMDQKAANTQGEIGLDRSIFQRERPPLLAHPFYGPIKIHVRDHAD